MNERGVKRIRFIVAEQSQRQRSAIRVPTAFTDGEPDEADLADLARTYLTRVLEHTHAGPRSFVEEAAPTLGESKVQRSKLTRSSLVRFTQSQDRIPIFGSDIMVELDERGQLVGVEATLASVEDASTEPNLTPSAAVAKVAGLGGVEPASLKLAAEPTLTFFRDEEAAPETAPWHLAWLIRGVPFAPAAPDEGHARHAHGRSPRTRGARHDYLIDAHDGALLLHYSTTPCARAAAGLPVLPVRCRGVDALGETQEFYGRAVKGGFELSDPQRKLRTFDLELGDISGIDIRIPSQPIHHEHADFSKANPAAVSAHVNVTRVWDFYNAVLQRDSVDDRGMELVSIVNCTSKDDADPDGDPREWANAIWWQDKMWYGQTKDGKKGGLRTFATHLDIIGHELTHGVIENSSGLIYQGQSGALNESFADIMGIVIANWYTSGPDAPVSRWTWALAPGYGEDGAPLRDLSNPKRTGDPAHMKDFLRTRDDDGGVHSNSNIHNKAAYNVFTAEDSKGQPIFSPREAAILYYLTLVRLPQRATFSRTLRVLLDVATTFYALDEAERARKLRAIEAAYRKVGIEPDPG